MNLFVEQAKVKAADGTTLTVNVYGRGRQDVLLLHGWPHAGTIWALLAKELAALGNFRCVAPHYRGFGASEKARTGYTCDGFADDAAAVAAALRMENAVVIGHSMSGKVAQVLAARRPPWLARLVLLCPATLAAGNVPEEERAQQRAVCGDAAKIEKMLRDTAAQPMTETMENWLSWLVEDALKANEAAWNGWIDTMREEKLSPLAAKIAAPTLVLHGERDPLRTEDSLRRVVGKIVGARFAVLPGVGHLPHVEDAASLAAVIAAFSKEGAEA